MKRRKGKVSPPDERLYRRLISHGLERNLSVDLALSTILSKESNLKLTEKQLLAEIIMLLENIRNDAKINSETMNQYLKNISNYSGDVKNELKCGYITVNLR
mgnify:CR=1 FL=1